jgi:diadenosine tetraphosphate (Ap4A) HIT family hydrolase
VKPIDCPLCQVDKTSLLYWHPRWRVIDAQDPLFPVFTRVIWHAHVKEMSQLSRIEREELMSVVFEVESVMRAQLAPDKINLASLGNQVPHVHWHVIGRWRDDASFPDSVWTSRSKSQEQQSLAMTQRQQTIGRLPGYHDALTNHLQRVFS